MAALRAAGGLGPAAPLGRSAEVRQILPMAKPALDLSALSPDEKVDLIDELWTSLRADELALTPEQTAELDRRLERLEREGPTGVAWEDVRAEMSGSRT